MSPLSLHEYRHGVVYTPSTADSAPQANLEDDKYLDSLGVKYIRITWLDYINKPRYRVVPRAYFKKLLESSRPGVSLAKATLGLVSLSLAPGFTGTGSYHYVLDTSSFRLAPYAPGHASIMGFFQEKTPSPHYGLVVPFCPRWILKQIVDKAQSIAGATYLIGFESEFVLLSSTVPEPVAVNLADWATSSKMPSGSVEYTVMEEIADCLVAAGIELQAYHAESAPGQVSSILICQDTNTLTYPERVGPSTKLSLALCRPFRLRMRWSKHAKRSTTLPTSTVFGLLSLPRYSQAAVRINLIISLFSISH